MMKRRNVLAALAATFATGCSRIAGTDAFKGLADAAEGWHLHAHRALAGKQSLAREFSPSDVSPYFRGNGTTQPPGEAYAAHVAENFANWKLRVSGLVDKELSLSLEELKALPQRSQITRHDCVEGWSAIGQWQGPQLSEILEMAGVREEAQFIVFHCADNLNGADYYESVDMAEAFHPQTIVAHELNGEQLPVRNGAPLRMRIERQLGYKHAKYLTAVEAVASLEEVNGGKGGYWEDRAGYQWYAGI